MERLKVQSDRTHYRADSVIIWCFDYRCSLALNEFIKARNFKRYDLISIAGGAKSLASPSNERDRSFIIAEIEKSINLHAPQEIDLMVHEDCGAYGGSVKHSDIKAETDFLTGELSKASDQVKKYGLKTTKILFTFDELRFL